MSALLLGALFAASPVATHTTLDDGTVLVVLPRPGATEVSVRWVIRAGADDEPSSRAGLAHLVEHLVFRSPSAEKLRATITAQQGHLNAITTATSTTFELDLPRASFDKGLGALAQLVTTVDTTPLAISSELGVVQHENELRRRTRNGTIERAVFGDRMVGGSEASFGRITRADVVTFLERFYGPGHTTLLVVGDVTEAEVKAVVEAESRWPPGAQTEPKPLPTVPERVRVSVSDFPYGQAFTADRFSLEDRAACRAHAAAKHLQALRKLPPSRTTVTSDCVVVHGWAFAMVLTYSLDERAEALLDQLVTATAPKARGLSGKDFSVVERRLKAQSVALASSPLALANALVAVVPYLSPEQLVRHAMGLLEAPSVTAASLSAAKTKVLGEPIYVLDGPFPERLTRVEKP
jgi:hypothetical protein